MKIFGREPAFWVGVIMSLISLAVSLGLKLTGSQVSLIETLLTSLLPLVAGMVIRTQVTPTEKAEKQIQIGIDSQPGTSVSQVIAKEERIHDLNA